MSHYSATRLTLELLQAMQAERRQWPPWPKWIDPTYMPHAATASNGSTTLSQHMNDAQIEQAIQAKGLTAPRVTPQELMDNITDVEFVKHVSKSGQVLRWAVITTRNGFAVTGRPSCSASSQNDDEELGKDMAFTNAKNELWPLMGYELRSRLAAGTAS